MEPMAKQLADAHQCGVYQLIRSVEEVEQAANKAGLAAFRIDIGDARDKKDFLTRLAAALSFPDWFGGNWDATNDCLTDLEWLPKKTGYVLVFEKSDHFAVNCKQDFEVATSVLGAAAEFWKEHGRPFWALVRASKGWDSGLPKWPKS